MHIDPETKDTVDLYKLIVQYRVLRQVFKESVNKSRSNVRVNQVAPIL